MEFVRKFHGFFSLLFSSGCVVVVFLADCVEVCIVVVDVVGLEVAMIVVTAEVCRS